MWSFIGLACLACGVITYGGVFAYRQREFAGTATLTQEGDKMCAFGMALLGPVGFVVAVFATEGFKHGWEV